MIGEQKLYELLKDFDPAVGAVSYTHLDVYKRQEYSCKILSIFLFKEEAK